MTILRRTLLLLVAAAALAWPAAAAAQAGPVHRALTGGVVDPGATALYIAPPRQGMVIVYRDGEAVGWFVNPGYLTVAPNGVYGIVATRNSSLLFNAQFLLRPGLTRVEWADGNVPSVLFHPAYPPMVQRPGASSARPPAAPAARPPARPQAQPPRAGAVPRSVAQPSAPQAAAPSSGFAELLRQIDAVDDDHDRYRTLREGVRGQSLSSAQKSEILGRFRSASMRQKASALLGVEPARSAPRKAVRIARR
jgi:hypothetical protein